MNESKAKKIRKTVYGDYSHKHRECKTDKNGTVRCVGLRAEYQKVKKGGMA